MGQLRNGGVRELMRKTVILHIGASKAGSSSIQAFLRRNRFAFAKRGYIIPSATLTVEGPVSGDHVFALEGLAKAGGAPAFRERIAELFARSGPDTKGVIFSAENLSNAGNSAIAAGLNEGYDVRIVMYLRRQDELLTSAWQQWGSKLESDFNAWLIMALKQYGHWDRTLAEWQRHVGREAMVVRVFERQSFVNEDLLQDFVDAIDLDPAGDGFDFEQAASNASVTDAITAMVSGNRQIFKDSHDNRFYTALDKLMGNALVEKTKLSLLTRVQRDKIIEYYRPINEAVCREYFRGRPRLFTQVDHAKYRYPSADQMVDEKLRALMTIVAALVRDRAD